MHVTKSSLEGLAFGFSVHTYIYINTHVHTKMLITMLERKKVQCEMIFKQQLKLKLRISAVQEPVGFLVVVVILACP